MYVKKVGVAYDVNHGGTRRILKVNTLNYYFQQKHCIYTQLDGHARILIKSTRLFYGVTLLRILFCIPRTFAIEDLNQTTTA